MNHAIIIIVIITVKIIIKIQKYSIKLLQHEKAAKS